MLKKHPKSAIRKFIKRGAITLFLVEAVAFVGSYGVWHKLNTERDFRLYVHKRWPVVLNGFYTIGETFDSNCNTREIDLAYWKASGDLIN